VSKASSSSPPDILRLAVESQFLEHLVGSRSPILSTVALGRTLVSPCRGAHGLRGTGACLLQMRKVFSSVASC
jgi:hypothetical protein